MKDILIDITITATRRPEILRKTLDTFVQYCFKPIIDQCRVIINIDPIGDNVPSCNVSDLVEMYFDRFIVGMPWDASFPRAFIWCWRQASAPWVFHLEEDWELLQSVDIMDMIRVMEAKPNLAVLRLPYRKSNENNQKNWTTFYPWNGTYFECPAGREKELGFCGHPSLIRGDFVRRTTPFMNPELNPEKQFHGNHPIIMDIVKSYKYGTWGKPNDGAYIKDIGRDWMMLNGWVKKGAKAFFTNWERTTS